MKKYDILESKDGKCPYCLSEIVFKVGDDEAQKIRHLIPGGDHIIWKCFTCNKFFYTT